MKFFFAWVCYSVLAFLFCISANAQRINQYSVETGTLFSSSQTPFWLRANQYGIIPLKNPALRLNAKVYSDYKVADSIGHKAIVDWGYGLNVVTNIGATNQVVIPEMYVKGRLGAFEIYAGRRRELIGLVDTLLTSGSYIWSGNSLPFPKIQVSLPAFTSVPFTSGIVSIMGTFSHGWFENANRLVKGSYLHQSSFYGRLGKPSWRVKLYGGANHQVMWAGHSDYLDPTVAANGQLPSGIKYFPAVVLGTQNPFPGDQTIQTISRFEENRIGNHLGSIDLAVEVNSTHWNLFAYRQFVYDDGSLFYGTNLDDGLNGLRIRNNHQPGRPAFFLRQITVEYLFTGSQGGDVFILEDPQRRGRDDYFNNAQYLDGWTYFGRTVGTPFLTPQQEVNPSLPPHYGIANNRVSAFHVGLSALVCNKVDIMSRLSLSRNAGTYAVPYLRVPSQFSGLITASLPISLLGGTVLTGSLAVDSGGLLPNSVGGYISLRKTGVLNRKRPTVNSTDKYF
ncbi:capsule assembly Wzi family protein [Spirosoma luteum]|uniref:capsule assembly Wzi family protein n=1 Tax=Spirosoma luteum TaxID=431553 RepID=UPI0003705443|nr:capsule assembly Wzi family protein [Spirosoma luteum]